MKPTIHNEDIARIFEKMSRVLSLKGQNQFRILAYENAARSIRDMDQDLARIAAEGKLGEISGIGKDLAGKIEEGLRTGHIRECERECGRIPFFFLREKAPQDGRESLHADVAFVPKSFQNYSL